MITTSTKREIRNSFSRWFAILAIVALGVGFFSGLKVSKEAFVTTGDKYLKDYNMFDYELISTLGLTEMDVYSMAGRDYVSQAEGTYSTDALVSVDGNERAARMLTAQSLINKPKLFEGRLPENGNECIIDHNLDSPAVDAEDNILGKTLKISELNDDDTKDMFKYDEYTIVGVAESPLYINYERGSTSLGDGSVGYFVMIPKDGWDMEVFTEMYIKLKDSDYEIFSQEYKDAVKPYEDILEDDLRKLADARYESIMDEAEDKLGDAEKELKDAKKELKDGKNELKDSAKKLYDSQADINTGKKEIKKGLAEIAEGEKTISESLDQIEAGLSEIALGETQLEAGYAELESYKGMLPESQYNLKKAELDGTKAELTEKRIYLESQKAEVEKQKTELTKAKAAIEKNLKKLENAQKKVNKGYTEWANGKNDLKEGEDKIKEAEDELKDARKEVDDVEEADIYVLGRDKNVGYVCFENDSAIVSGVAKVFPVLFFLVAALVVMTTMTRMIDEQRTQIGVLKALGYEKKRIRKKYTIYSGSAALIGGIIGFFAGSYLFPYVIWIAYGMMYKFSDLIPVFNPVIGAGSIIVSLICAIGSTLFSISGELREVPAQLIRPKAPALGKRILLERIGFIWKSMPFLHKVSARNIFRYKKRFFMMVLGISGCTALLTTGFGLSDSIKNVANDQYDNIFLTDYTITFNDEISMDEMNDFRKANSEDLEDILFLKTITADAEMNGQIKSVNLVVVPEENEKDIDKFIDIHSEGKEKEKIAYPGDGECVINGNLAIRLGLEVGDTIILTDTDRNEISAKITDLCENFVYNYMYINQKTYEDQMGEMKINSAFALKADSEASESEVAAKLRDQDKVTGVTVSNDFRDRVNHMMVAMDYVVILVVASAGALAFIVLYNLTNINITERIREIATIKVLGFNRRETSQYIFRENFVLTFISALVGLPLGFLLHRFVMSKVIIDLISFNVVIDNTSYVYAFVMTFVFALIVNFVMYFRLDKINMAESLKSIE